MQNKIDSRNCVEFSIKWQVASLSHLKNIFLNLTGKQTIITLYFWKIIRVISTEI